jgi:mannosyltransferase
MRDNRANFAAAVLPALLALALRFYDLGGKPLWLDEIITHKRALLPFSELVSDSLTNKHLPSYFILVRAFDAPGINEWLLRLPSAIFGSLAVLMAALIAAQVRAPRAGLVAGMLMALSPIEVQFSQEARSYALVSCLVLLALWGLVRIAQTSVGTAMPRRLDRAPLCCLSSGWPAYALGTIAAVNVLLVAALWWLASNLAMAVIIFRAASRGRLVRRWLLLQAAITLISLPGMIAIYRAGGGDQLHGFSWIPPSTFEHVARVLSAVYLFRASDMVTFALLPAPVPWLGIIVIAFAVFGLWQLRRDDKLLAAIGLAAIAMPAAMLMLSIFHPVWIPRYLLWGTGAFYILAGIGTAALPRRLFIWTTAVLIVGGAGNLAPYYRAETKPRWDLAGHYLAMHARPSDVIVTNDYPTKYALSAYAANYGVDLPILYGNNGALVFGKERPARVWVVYGVGQGTLVTEERYRQKWSSFGMPIATVQFGKHVVLWRFEQGGSAAPSKRH